MALRCPACSHTSGRAFEVSTAGPGRVMVTFRCDDCQTTWTQTRKQAASMMLKPDQPAATPRRPSALKRSSG